MTHIGEVIKEIRIEKGHSQRWLALRSGIANTAICRWERGLADMQFTSLIKIAGALRMPVSEVVKRWEGTHHDQAMHSMP